MSELALDDITNAIITAAIKVHRRLGPGLLESAYELLLARELEQQGLSVVRQKMVSFYFEDILIENAFRIDLLVEGAVIVEVKSIERVLRVHGKQLLTYLRTLDLQVGLLLNFNCETLKEGIHRVVNNLRREESPLLRVNNKKENLRASP